MVMPKNYKGTEIDVIPKDWQVYTFDDTFEIFGGYSASRDQLTNEGHCYLHYGDIHGTNKTYIDTDKDYISIPKLNIDIKKISKNSLLIDGDIVFVDASEDDEGASKYLVVRNPSAQTFISGLHTIIARKKNELLERAYSEYCFKSEYIKSQFSFYSAGTKVTGISKSNIKKIVFSIPSVDEQKRIAEALSDIDELIWNLEKLITKKKDIKQGAMQELLAGNKRLKGFNKKWVKKSLDEVCIILNGDRGVNYPSGKDFVTNGIPFINAGHLNNCSINFKNMDFITYEHYEQLGGAKLQKHDILFCLRGSLGKFAIVNIEMGAPASSLCVIRCTNNICYKYLYFILSSEIIVNQIQTANSGSSQPNLSAENVKNFIISIPEDIQEQTAIVTILSDMDTEISELEKKLAKYTDIKQGMMQELLTGRIRLPASDKAPVAMPKAKSTNKHFEEVVVLSTMVALFSSEKYPMGRFRRQKFAYLFERYTKQNVDGFLKKPAGPYNPTIRYKDENIAIKSKYVMEQGKGKFVKGEKSEEAMDYFIKWYGEDAITWINQFKYRKSDDLELLTTVAEAIRELIEADKEPTLLAVKEIIAGNSEWKPKLEKDFFNDNAIQLAIKESIKLFHQ